MKKYIKILFLFSFFALTFQAYAESPSITVLSPNGGESYTDEQQITVKWSSSDLPENSPVNLVLTGYNSNGLLVMNTLLSQNVILNDGSEIVNLPKIPTYAGINFGKYFKIEVNYNGAGTIDSSDNYFTISSKTSIIPSIKVTSPNDTHIALDSGQKIEIRWDSNVSINALVDVYVSDGTHKGAVIRGNNNGAHGLIYTLDSNLVPGSNYKACVSILSEVPISDCSNNPFTIKPIVIVSDNENIFKPLLKVTSPNDTHIALDPGQKIEIRWDSNVSINALVDVYVSDGTHKGPTVRGNNTGNLIYNPGNLPAGSNYKAYVSLFSETPTNSSSEFPFTIRAVNIHDQLPAGEYGKTVENVAQNLLNVATKEKGEVGEKIKVIIDEQKNNQENITNGIDKIQNRSKIKTFLIGTDYKNVGQVRSEIVKTNNQIDELNGLLEKTVNTENKKVLEGQIQTLEEQQQKVNTVLTANESKFSLFGWFLKFFNK